MTMKRPTSGQIFTYFLAAILIAGCCAAESYAQLVAHWDFEEGSGTTTKDQVNNSNDPLTDVTWVTDPSMLPPVPGGTTAAVEFDGVFSVIDTEFAGVGGTEPRTIATWVKLAEITDAAASQTIVAYGGREADGRKWHFRINDGGDPRVPGAVRTEAQGGNQTGTTNIADGHWHHVASVFPGGPGSNNTDVIHYVDGKVEGETGTTDEPIDTTIGGDLPHVSIGARRQGGNSTFDSPLSDFLNGMLDDVRIYNQALSPLEIQSLVFSDVPELGDFNADGSIDLADFAILAGNFNATGNFTEGDMDFNGMVDLEDFVLWRAVLNAPAGAAAVPEPTSAWPIMIAALACGLFCRRRKTIR